MAQVPSNLIPIRVSQLDTAPVASEDGLLLYVYQGESYKIRAGDLLQVAGVPISRQVIAGTGLQGGGQLAENVTLSIAPGGVGYTQLAVTGVSAGVYGNSTNVPVITVDDKGRITAATTVPVSVSGFVPLTREIIAGDGLIGGGSLNNNVTLSAKLSNNTPNSVETSGSAGVSTEISRSDHRHPAVDLSSDDQVDNILGLNNGGTANSLVPEPGGIVYSGADALYIAPAGVAGQVLISGGTSSPSWGSALVVSPQSAHHFFVGPAAGSPADPTFRAMVNADLPNSGATAGTYGSALAIPIVTVNSKGVITNISTTAFTGGLSYKGAWNAATNSPALASGVGTNGDYYIVSVAGSTNLDGITDWQVGDWALFNGTIWQKIDQTNSVTSVNGQQGAVVLTYSDVGAPSTSGTGATGTWTISISGNAGTVTNGVYTTGSYADPTWLTSLATSKLSGTISNAQLANSAITINGSSVSLGGSTTITAVNPYALTIGSGLSGTSYDGSAAVTITNTAPDQIVSLTGAGTTVVTGTYPNFTITSNDAYVGTVTSVGTGTGLTGGPITTSGTINFSNAAVGTWAATPSSANLAAAMTDETGSGSLVFANSPSLSSPTIDGANPYIQFSNGAAVALAAGRMWYDGATGSWNLGMGGGNITQQVGEELYVYGKASAAITDSPLRIVYQTGTVGGSGVITFAPTTSGITNGDLIVGVATEPIALNGFGRVTSYGIVRGITTDGAAYGETWADGDVIWYNPVTGNPTNVKPVAPNLKVSVGVLIKAGPGGSGAIQVEINHGSVLGGTDSNVQITSVANNDLLQYYAAGGYWRNVTPASVTGVGSLANALTIGTGLSGTSYNGSSAVTIANTGVLSLTGTANQVAVSASTGNITLSLPATINVNTSGNAATVTNGVYTTGSYADPSWITSLAGSKITGNISGNAGTATSLAGGAASQIPYQSAAGTTSFIPNGTAGQVLVSAGAGAPAWSGVYGGSF